MGSGFLLSFNPKTSIFIEDSPGNKHYRLAKHSLIILNTYTTFWLVSQSNALIYVFEKSIPSKDRILIGHPIKPQYRGLVNKASQPTSCLGSISFHFNQNKSQRSDLLTATGGQEMSWFKLGQRTDKPQKLFTFCFDNLKVQLVLTFEINFSISFKVYNFFTFL